MHYLSLLLLAIVLSSCGTESVKPRLLLISVDGFRWDYLDQQPTPNMHALFESGFRVNRMEPAWPSNTFPNHYTLVTGKEPAEHGLVGNWMWDRETTRLYGMGQPESLEPYWYDAPALWEVAGAQGLKTASYFWVGSETNGRQPHWFKPYDSDATHEDRLIALENWLDPTSDFQPHLMMIYFPDVDDAGHKFGPTSPELAEAVAKVDRTIGKIQALIAASGQPVNVVIVSDHGMTDLVKESMPISAIEEALGPDLEKVINHYAHVDIFLKDGSPDAVEAALKKLPQQDDVTWHTRQNPPGLLHPTRNGHIIGTMVAGHEFYSKPGTYRGAHGYAVTHPDMGAICMGSGPAFKPGSTISEVKATQVFALSAHVLGLSTSATELSPWEPILSTSTRE